MQRLIAETKLRNNGEWIMPGGKFTASDQDAEDLVAMRMARKETVVEKVVTAATDTAEAISEAAAQVAGRTSASSRRPTYRRRDLNAEETKGSDK